MDNSIRQILEEYVLYVDGLQFQVKGRVMKEVFENGTFKYSWDISHFCKPSIEAATVYRPSTTSAETLERARQLLFMYMTPFTTIEVEENKFY